MNEYLSDPFNVALCGSKIFLCASGAWNRDITKPTMDKVAPYTTPVSTGSQNLSPIYRASSHASEIIDSLLEGEINNTYELFQRGCRMSRTRPCLGTRKQLENGSLGEYEWIQYGEVDLLAKTLGSGLLHKELVETVSYDDEIYERARQLKPIGICSKNRLEWFITDIACQAYGLTSIPLYDTLGTTAILHVLGLTRLTCIVGASENLLGILKTIEDHCKETQDKPDGAERNDNLKSIIVFADIALDELIDKARNLNIEVYTWKEIIDIGKTKEILPIHNASKDDVAGICFTSGTTGVPKGALLTHGMFVATVCAALRGPLTTNKGMLNADDCYISYLPLAHVLERILITLVFTNGAQVAIYSGEARTLLDDIKMARPTIFVSVPRLFMRIHERILHGVNESSFIARYLFNRGVEAKKNLLRSEGIVVHGLWDRLVFNKTKALMGGRLRFMLSGGAALDLKIQEDLACYFCCPIVEGYGLTETLGATFIRNMNDNIYGHIGGPIPAIELRLESAPEMEYFAEQSESKDGLERGEILLRGPSVMPNYFRNINDTKLMKTEDGWLRTGDIAVRLREGGRIKIIDRRKDIFKLSQGEYIAPERIENIYVGAPLLCQAFVYGDSSHNNLVGIFCVDEEMVRKWAGDKLPEDLGSNLSLKDLAERPELRQEIQKQMNQEEIAHKLNGFEKVKSFYLETEQFSVDNELLTPTFKLRRNNAKRRYSGIIDMLFNQSPSTMRF